MKNKQRNRKKLDEEKHKIYVIIQWILLTDVDVFLTFYLLQWVKNLKGSGLKAQIQDDYNCCRITAKCNWLEFQISTLKLNLSD